jgi:hypothetical protein
MGLGDFTKSGAFVATVFALVVVLMPFGLEQVGDATDLFKFPATKTIREWFAGTASDGRGTAGARPVDWERYRQDLVAFSQWAERQEGVVISLPREPETIHVKEMKDEPRRRVWRVPVAGCTAGDPSAGKKGYIFISGFGRPFEEGGLIAPSEEKCGFEIVCVGERTVWLRAVTESDGDVRMGVVRLPDFARVEDGTLVRGKRRYVVRDAFPLESGGWLMLDSFLRPDGVVFKILDESRREVTTLLCVVIDEKGGK